jgi:hypothetical protein
MGDARDWFLRNGKLNAMESAYDLPSIKTGEPDIPANTPVLIDISNQTIWQ